MEIHNDALQQSPTINNIDLVIYINEIKKLGENDYINI